MSTPETPAPLTCRRCAVPLRPGTGDLYQVTIEAVADPAPPVLSGDESAADLRRQIEQLLAGMEGVPEQELLKQVYQRLTLYLCGPCYRQWIKNPTG